MFTKKQLIWPNTKINFNYLLFVFFQKTIWLGQIKTKNMQKPRKKKISDEIRLIESTGHCQRSNNHNHEKKEHYITLNLRKKYIQAILLLKMGIHLHWLDIYKLKCITCESRWYNYFDMAVCISYANFCSWRRISLGESHE